MISTLCAVLSSPEWSGALPSPCWTGSEINKFITGLGHVQKKALEAPGGFMVIYECLLKELAEMACRSSCGHCPVQTQSPEPDAALLPLV